MNSVICWICQLCSSWARMPSMLQCIVYWTSFWQAALMVIWNSTVQMLPYLRIMVGFLSVYARQLVELLTCFHLWSFTETSGDTLLEFSSDIRFTGSFVWASMSRACTWGMYHQDATYVISRTCIQGFWRDQLFCCARHTKGQLRFPVL
jgi:hypothetical protein